MITNLTKEEYKNVCGQLDYEQNKFNKAFKEWLKKENGMRIVINALTELKDQYEHQQQ
ncbi:MAG: hypothetical protein H8D45_01985 [Bacteroidetes bacterium]|nr:hypothetical protein [Bacteroidota bacterium]